jgi:hypothetical protein
MDRHLIWMLASQLSLPAFFASMLKVAWRKKLKIETKKKRIDGHSDARQTFQTPPEGPTATSY